LEQKQRASDLSISSVFPTLSGKEKIGMAGTYVNPKSLFLQFNIDIFESNTTPQVDSSIGNNDINTLDPLFLDLLDRLFIS
jgi:hypothetical protein